MATFARCFPREGGDWRGWGCSASWSSRRCSCIFLQLFRYVLDGSHPENCLVRVAMLKESISKSALSLSAPYLFSLNCDLCWYILDLFCHLMLNPFKTEICLEDTHTAFASICIKHTHASTHTHILLKQTISFSAMCNYRSSDCGTDVRHSFCTRLQLLHSAFVSCSAHDSKPVCRSLGLWFKLPPRGQNMQLQQKTTAINLVQLLRSPFTFHYSLLHHLENGSCVSLPWLSQLLLNLRSPSPFQTLNIKMLLPL